MVLKIKKNQIFSEFLLFYSAFLSLEISGAECRFSSVEMLKRYMVKQSWEPLL